MNKNLVAFGLLSALYANAGLAGEGPVPAGVPPLNHVFVIMMENHGYSQIINNPSAPFTNNFVRASNLAANYFAVAHPSLTNYLEVVGGSNFGVLSDNNTDWHNFYCTPNLQSGTANTDQPASGNICPISGIGSDAPTPAIDTTNETTGAPGDINIDGHMAINSADNTFGKSIADQLAEAGMTWKSYQEDLPEEGADLVDYSDGLFSNTTNLGGILPLLNPPLSQAGIVSLYAAKHNPFVYFQSVQEGFDPMSSLANSVGFIGQEGLYADLATGHVPNFAFIAPNQCNDQHGRGNAGQSCNFDPTDNGTQAGLNPALILRGDVTVRRLVSAIRSSPAWSSGKNAIVLLWDENDYATSPETNQVILAVDTSYGSHGVFSHTFYTHFSLLKSLESGFGLPCLNHACDASVSVMTDLFGTTAPAPAAPMAETAVSSTTSLLKMATASPSGH